MKKLTEIANYCQTDKGYDFDEGHGYTEYYEYWLSKYKNPKILEIGSFRGASTKMFDEFYNHNCEIWTYDIDYTNYNYKFNKDNIHCFQGNQNDEGDWKRFFETSPDKFDIIIDDGSHMPEHQMHTLFWLHNHLTESGIYILEDLHTYMWDNRNNSPLYFLNFWDQNDYLTTGQKYILFDRLIDEIVIHRKNEKSNYCKRSITSILRFKQ